MSKLLLVFVVFIVVFSPKKIPFLVKEISRIFVKYNFYKQKLIDFWNINFLQELNLLENNKKAQAADQIYLEKNINTNIDK